jgi:hypothetical protein
MVREWVLSERIGPVGFATDGPGYLGEGALMSRPYAEDTQRVIDEEVSQLLRDAQERATELLSTHPAGDGSNSPTPPPTGGHRRHRVAGRATRDLRLGAPLGGIGKR